MSVVLHRFENAGGFPRKEMERVLLFFPQSILGPSKDRRTVTSKKEKYLGIHGHHQNITATINGGKNGNIFERVFQEVLFWSLE